VSSTNTAAAAERWFRDTFCRDECREADAQGTNVYALMHAMARDVPPGAEGLFFHPYLLGERSPYWDANLRASFVGATMRHGKGHFVRALLEGVAFSLRDCFRTILEMNLAVNEIRLIGGGAKSDLWAQIVADVFDKPIVRPAGCDASFGSALLAGVGVGIFANEAAAVQQCTQIRDRIEPNPALVEKYARLFPLYCEIHDNLAGTYAKLSTVL
jgi:xylulokinase